MRKPNPFMLYVRKLQKKYPDKSFKEIIKIAKKTYKKDNLDEKKKIDKELDSCFDKEEI